jgi:hypothetical protein
MLGTVPAWRRGTHSRRAHRTVVSGAGIDVRDDVAALALSVN